MKGLVIALCLFLFSFCGIKNNPIPHSNEFRDCIDFMNDNFCIQFEIDSSYTRTLDLNGSGWGPTKSYRFISELDTIVVSVFLSKGIKCDTVSTEVAKKVLQDKLFKGFGCLIDEYRPVNSFFEGKMVSCKSPSISVLEYYGSDIKDFEGIEAGVYIGSESNFSNEKVYDHFMKVVKSIKVINIPRDSISH